MEKSGENGVKKSYKKRCLKCGELLWLRDFGIKSNKKNFPTGRDCWCKKCRCEQRKMYYHRNKKSKDGIKLNSEGRAVKKHGYSVKLYWDDSKVEAFKKAYPVTPNEELAIDFEVSESTIHRRAREYGLVKDEEYIRRKTQKALAMAQRVNKAFGNKADLTNFIKGGIPHRFKPGNIPPCKRRPAELTATEQ